MTDEPAQERRVIDLAAEAGFDLRAYSFVTELKRILSAVKDEGTSIDTGTGPREADLWITVGGVEFYMVVRPSNNQLLKEGVTREELGLPSIAADDGRATPEAPPPPTPT